MQFNSNLTNQDNIDTTNILLNDNDDNSILDNTTGFRSRLNNFFSEVSNFLQNPFKNENSDSPNGTNQDIETRYQPTFNLNEEDLDNNSYYLTSKLDSNLSSIQFLPNKTNDLDTDFNSTFVTESNNYANEPYNHTNNDSSIFYNKNEAGELYYLFYLLIPILFLFLSILLFFFFKSRKMSDVYFLNENNKRNDEFEYYQKNKNYVDESIKLERYYSRPTTYYDDQKFRHEQEQEDLSLFSEDENVGINKDFPNKTQ